MQTKVEDTHCRNNAGPTKDRVIEEENRQNHHSLRDNTKRDDDSIVVTCLG